MEHATKEIIIRLENVSKSYAQAGQKITALAPISLQVNAGEIVALTGASGAGKSTLLHIAGLLLQPDAGGQQWVDGVACDGLRDKMGSRLRQEKIGFVYQFHHLLPELTAWENVAMPLWMAGVAKKPARARAMAFLEQCGLADRAEHLPSELSGGQQQRVAIARALVHRPRLLLADEPTGNLDPATAHLVEEMMFSLVRESGAGALIVTHNLAMAQRMDRVIALA